jgi:nitrogen regulatory protein PII
MELKKLTAIICVGALEAVEEKLKDMHVHGITVSEVEGYGEYAGVRYVHGGCRTSR